MSGEGQEEGGEQGTRLQVLVARAGIASRRAAEELIRAGRVAVNGTPVTELGARARLGDMVTVDGRPIAREARTLRLALNKPPGYLCAMSDTFGRPLAADLLKPAVRERVYNVGRLDLESCGLIFFTNDGDFAAKAGHPSYGLVKEYEIETDRRLHATFGAQFEAGLEVDAEEPDGTAQALSGTSQGRKELLKARKVLVRGERACTIWLAEGKNREIRRALALFGLKATLLKRVAIGPVRLGDLPEGRFRELSPAELAALDGIFSEARKRQ